MSRGLNKTAIKQRKLPLLGMAGALMLALPTASLAVVRQAPLAKKPRQSTSSLRHRSIPTLQPA